jgi:hypothetical protein
MRITPFNSEKKLKLLNRQLQLLLWQLSPYHFSGIAKHVLQKSNFFIDRFRSCTFAHPSSLWPV